MPANHDIYGSQQTNMIEARIGQAPALRELA
jgi:hypothetical protein